MCIFQVRMRTEQTANQASLMVRTAWGRLGGKQSPQEIRGEGREGGGRLLFWLLPFLPLEKEKQNKTFVFPVRSVMCHKHAIEYVAIN